MLAMPALFYSTPPISLMRFSWVIYPSITPTRKLVSEGHAETYEARFNPLKEAAPDLAEMVVEEKLSLEEAEAAERERAERTRHNKKLVVQALYSLAAHAYLLAPPRQDEVVQLITCEAELYTHYAAGPVDEFIEALAIFEQHASVLLGEIRKKREKANVEKG
jgi:hypothetical protein